MRSPQPEEPEGFKYLELEPDDPPVEEAEVERDRAREVAVVLEQERRTHQVRGTGRVKCQVGDVGRRVVREAHGTLRGESPTRGHDRGEGSGDGLQVRRHDPKMRRPCASSDGTGSAPSGHPVRLGR